jgi:uncharacterized protein with ParB-like and HNH nuclease domain
MKITQILDKIDEDQLFVPAFQREYVWKKDDVKALLNSLMHEYPTGTILTWETSSPPELKGSIIKRKTSQMMLQISMLILTPLIFNIIQLK